MFTYAKASSVLYLWYVNAKQLPPYSAHAHVYICVCCSKFILCQTDNGNNDDADDGNRISYIRVNLHQISDVLFGGVSLILISFQCDDSKSEVNI